MTAILTQFFQCELCCAYCDQQGARLDPQPRFGVDRIGVPELIVCEICTLNPPAVAQPTLPAFNRSRRNQNPKPCGQPGNARPAGSSWAERSLPPERDDARELASADGVTPTHKDQVVHFDAQSAARDELVLRELCRTFDVERPEQPGQWVTGIYFLEHCGIKAANSCASRLRRSHPFISANDLDVDSAMIPNGSGTAAEWWAYRICRRCDSERIKREAKRREQEGQREFGE